MRNGFAHRYMTLTEKLERRTMMSAATDATGFYVPVQLTGETPVTLYPVESVQPNQATRVSFGVPFSRGFVPTADLSRVKVLDAGGAERAASVQMLTPWRDLAALVDEASVRSALVQVDVTFPDANGDGVADPVQLRIAWGGAARSQGDLTPVPVRDTWVQVNDASFPASVNVWEPKAYAAFTPQWYGQALLKMRLQPMGTDSDFSAYESAFVNFGGTFINDVDPRVTDANRIHYLTDGEPWLYDRGMSLYQLAFRTGELKWLREAHRNTQFYANTVNPRGYFQPEDNDLKYSYGESINANYWLTGDPRIPDVHRLIIPVFDRDFNVDYQPGRIWTERSAAYKLQAYVTGFELLGDAAVGQKAKDTFNHLLDHQANPPAGAPNIGLLMHRSEDHLEGGPEWVASPWMTSLLVDTAVRYYIHSGDTRVKQFVTRIADGINRIGETIYYENYQGTNYLVSYYLGGVGLNDDQHQTDFFGDKEHAIDVSRVFALAYYFTRLDGSPSSVYLGRFNELMETATFNFQYWTRPNGPESGLSVYRLSPPRKFGWWFKNTADIDFLVGADASPGPDTVDPTATLTAPTLTAGGGATYQFTITYFDNRGIDVSTLDSNDINVRGPNSFNQNATFVSVNSTADGTPRSVVYSVTAPGGTWDPADDGLYQIDIRPNQIADTSGRFVGGEFLGRFEVATTGAPMITNVTSGGVSNTGATITWTTDVATTTQVEYGPTAGYGQLTTLDAAMGTSHSVTLTGLSPGTTYHFRVLSRNAGGVLGASTDYTFTTTGTSGGGGGGGGNRTLVGEFGLVNNRNTVLRHTDGDGTLITASLRGGGIAQLYTEDGRLELDLIGTGPRSVLSLSGRGGDRRIALGDVVSAGPLRGAKLVTSDLFGTFFINGAAGPIALGSINGGTLAAAGDLFGVLVKGAVASGRVLAGANLGANGRLGGGDDAAGVGSIRRLTLASIAGTTGSVFAAGTLPGANGTYGDGDDVHAGGATSAILAIATRGDVDTATRFEAGTFGRAKIGRFRVDPTTDSRFVLVA